MENKMLGSKFMDLNFQAIPTWQKGKEAQIL